MKQITRDLYTSGRVWLSLSHSFTQKSGNSDYSFDLVKINGDFVTLNAGALFVLSLWSTGQKTPDKFYIPEYKIEEFRSILVNLNDLKKDEKYVRDGELTVSGKASTLYYRLMLNNRKYIDLYFVENDFNGDKSINIAIELPTKSGSKVFAMYDSNVVDLIDIIPTPSDIVKYKQSAAELYIMYMYLGKFNNSNSSYTEEKEEKPKKVVKKKAPPRTINKVDRTSISKEEISYVDTEEETESDETEEKEFVEEPEETIEESTDETEEKTDYDYSNLLEDE